MNAESLLSHLAEWSEAVNSLEKQAVEELHGQKNEAAYRDLMRRRAELLRSLPGKAAALPAALREEDAFSRVLEALEGFAQGASNALRINSIFYMSALLYPDEHKPGEPNNLERLLLSLAGH